MHIFNNGVNYAVFPLDKHRVRLLGSRLLWATAAAAAPPPSSQQQAAAAA